MKKYIWVFLVVLSILLVSCGTKNEQSLKNNLSDEEVVQNLEHINNAMDKAMNWGSEEDVMWELWKLKKVERNMNFEDLPDWLYDLWFEKPQWVTIDKDNSEITGQTVTLTYNANNIDNAVVKAEELAKKMNLPESKVSPRKLFESMSAMVTDEAQKEEMKKNMQWAMFTNCSWNDCTKEEYSEMISAFKDDNWNWILQIVIIKNEKK